MKLYPKDVCTKCKKIGIFKLGDDGVYFEGCEFAKLVPVSEYYAKKICSENGGIYITHTYDKLKYAFVFLDFIFCNKELVKKECPYYLEHLINENSSE